MKIISLFNVFISIFVPLLIGTRSSFIIVLMLTVISIIYLFFVKKYTKVLIMIVLVLTAGFLNCVCWNYNGIASYSNRILPSVFEFDESKENKSQAELNNDNDKNNNNNSK